MYPNKVYHCSCVAFEIKLCLIDGIYSLKDIILRLMKRLNLSQKIYATKCNNNDDVVFSCRNHMCLSTVCEKYEKTCFRCLKTFLRTSFWSYNYTNFDVPLIVKKENKTLCLIVKKL